MTAGARAADRPSLTLPDWRTALKRRARRRPPRPPFWVVFWMVALAANVMTARTPGDVVFVCGCALAAWAEVREWRHGIAVPPWSVLTVVGLMTAGLLLP